MSHPTRSQVERALTAVSAAMTPVNAFVEAMTSLPLGPQPLVVNGQLVGTFDPLSPTPQLDAALQTAQQDCEFQSLTGDVAGFAMAMDIAAPVFRSHLGTMLRILDQLVQSGATPTSAQMQQVQDAMQNVSDAVQLIGLSTSGMQESATDFLPQVTAAEQALNQGSADLENSIGQVRQFVENTVAQYAGTPAAEIVGAIGAQMLHQLRGLSAGLGDAAGRVPAATRALGKLEDLFGDIARYYDTLAGKLQDASASQLVPYLQQADLQLAQTFWDDLVRFVAGTGIWCANSPP